MLVGLALALVSSSGLARFSDREISSNNILRTAEMEKRCQYLGKIEYIGNGQFSVESDEGEDSNEDLGNNRFLFAPNGVTETIIQVIPTELKVEEAIEVIEFKFIVESGNLICGVKIKAARDLSIISLDCVDYAEGLRTPSYDEDIQHGISHIEFYYCDYYWDC